MRAERLISAETIRERLGKPSQEEIGDMMQDVHPGLVKSSIEFVFENVQQLLESSSGLKRAIYQSEGVVPSRRKLCVNVLLCAISAGLRSSFLDALNGDDKIFSRFYFDMDTGFRGVLGSILQTESWMKGDIEGEDIEAVAREHMDSIKNHSYEAPEYVNAGGKLASDLYKWVYEVTGAQAISLGVTAA